MSLVIEWEVPPLSSFGIKINTDPVRDRIVIELRGATPLLRCLTRRVIPALLASGMLAGLWHLLTSR